MPISQADYQAMLARTGQEPPTDKTTEGAADEVALQEEIITFCRSRGWWVDYSRPDLPTTRTKGSPDLFIFRDGGKLLVIECKSKNGKLRPEQLGVKLMLEKLGHTVHVVRSFEQFMLLLAADGKTPSLPLDAPDVERKLRALPEQ